MPVSFIGLLDAVNITIKSLVEVILLTWDAPFSLDITGVGPDILYRVNVTMVNVSTYLFTGEVNIPEFNFTVADGIDTNTSVIYQFQVTPKNGIGDGVTSSPVTGFFRRSELHAI